MTLLEVRDLALAYGKKEVLKGVDLGIEAGEVLALVGESGSGKSTLLKALLGLERFSRGHIRIDDRRFDPGDRRQLGDLSDRMRVVFQDSLASLDPRWPAWRSIAEGLIDGRSDARARSLELLREVGLEAELAERRPHQLSGGQRQRVAIARALAGEPRLILLDEATSALDVSVQAQILALLARLIKERGMAALFVTHDLAVVRSIADRSALLVEGRIVECRPTDLMLDAPEHPATRALLAAARLEALPVRKSPESRSPDEGSSGIVRP